MQGEWLPYGKPSLKSLKRPQHTFEFMRLEDELKEERMITPGVQIGPRIIHIDRGSNDQ